MKMKTILFATDYSEANKKALEFAASLARDHGASLIIAYVTSTEQYPVGELFNEEPEPDAAELAKLESVRPDDPEVKYEHRLVYGEPGSVETVKPADEIVKLAKKEEVDAIVLGTHGRTGLKHLVMGSVAESVVRNAPCPVLTIKQPEQERLIASH